MIVLLDHGKPPLPVVTSSAGPEGESPVSAEHPLVLCCVDGCRCCCYGYSVVSMALLLLWLPVMLWLLLLLRLLLLLLFSCWWRWHLGRWSCINSLSVLVSHTRYCCRLRLHLSQPLSNNCGNFCPWKTFLSHRQTCCPASPNTLVPIKFLLRIISCCPFFLR